MTILEALILFLPAGLANASPVIANQSKWLKQWSTPMDFGHTYRGKRIFGPNKTWRGIAVGTLIGVVSAMIINYFNPNLLIASGGAAFLPYFEMGLVGGMLGFGALYGDAIESFFKRQIGVDPGSSWFPFDQIDYILGALIAVAPLKIFSAINMLAILVVYFCLHLAVAFIGYKLKLKNKPI